MGMAPKDFQSEVRVLFEKLTSLREESHRQFSDIINSHGGSISDGINDLFAEVSNLQDELSVVRKERNVLLETVDNLKGEIRQLHSKLTTAHPLPELGENHDRHIQVEVGSEVDDSIEVEQDLERPGIHLDIDTEEVFQDDEYGFDTHNQYQNLHSSNDCNHLSDPPTNELTEDDVHNVDLLQKSKDLTQDKAGRSIDIDTRENNSEDYICPKCNFSFSTNENLAIHMENFHPNLNVSEKDSKHNEEMEVKSNPSKYVAPQEITVGHKERKRKYKCEECPYTSNYNGNLKTHIARVHRNIRPHVCEECGHGKSTKANLMYHMANVHNIGEKEFKCEQCPYASASKGHLKAHIDGVHKKSMRHVCEECGYGTSEKKRLKLHMVSVHNIGEKEFKCEQCPYATASNANLKRHNDTVHRKIRSHVCEECGHGTSTKANLMYHMSFVHNIGEKEFKCEQCTYETIAKANLKRHMESVHTVGDKKFKCELCPYKSHVKFRLKEHVKVTHLK